MIARSGRTTVLLCAAAVVILALIPLVTGTYWVRVLTGTLMFAVLAQAWNLTGGFAGYPSFGNTAFFGVGAYATGMLMVAGMPFALALPIAIVVGVVFALIVGLPVLRLSGHYFAIATFALAAIARSVVSIIPSRGGSDGVTLPLSPFSADVTTTLFYYAFLALALITLITIALLQRSRVGYALAAIRADEQAAWTMGINSTLYKNIAWAISAVVTAAAGGLYAYWTTFIEPTSVFDPTIDVKMIIMVLLGGSGTVLGPIVGAFALEIASQLIWQQFLTLHGVILSILIILVIFFIPKGIVRRTIARVKQKAPVA